MEICQGWHRLGERCYCGHVTIPARFYWYEDADNLSVMLTTERTQEKAEAAYVAWAEKNGVTIKDYLRPVTQAVTQTEPVTHDVTHCQDCGKALTGRGSRCGACRMRRSRNA